MSRFALVVLVLALASGAVLRFARLDALQMSADEGATWAAADAGSLGEVIAIQQTRNAGKLPVNDLILHEWIGLFGDSLPAMRALSAIFGLIAVALVLPTTRETFRIRNGDVAAALSADDIDAIGAIAALLCATSLITIKYTREARMYALLLAFAMAQVWLFLRTIRRGSLSDAIVLALMTAGLGATNLVTMSLLAAEGIWWMMLVATPRERHNLWLTAGAVAAGLALVAPPIFLMIRADAPRVREGLVNWLRTPPWWEAVAVFNKATGSIVFPVLAVLALYGIARAWSRARDAMSFALVWMWAPPILLVVGSYLWRPMFVERFVIFSFPPFFILVAAGLWELPPHRLRLAAIATIVILSLGHGYEYSRKPHDTDWREAARVAGAALAPNDTVAVSPAFAVEVVRYYMDPLERAHAIGAGPSPDAAILIVAAPDKEEGRSARIPAAYSRVLARPRGVVVLAR